MDLHKDLPVYLFKSLKEWEQWLDKNFDKVPAIWLKIAKKNSGVVSVSYEESVLVALCYGWIDGLINRFDEKFYLTRFTPRGEKSVWSKKNRELAKKLIKEGKMKPSGMKTIDAAKAHGMWDAAYESGATMQMPEDFLKELAKDKKANAFFNSLNKANTYAIGWRLKTAIRPEIRKKRMEKILEMLKSGEKFQ